MDNECVEHIHNGIFPNSLKKYEIHKSMDENGNSHPEWDNSDPRREMS